MTAIIDGNDRWQAEPTNENSLGRGHAFALDVAHALEGAEVTTLSNDALITTHAPAEALTRWDALIWTTGEESTADSTLDPTERGWITEYLAAGGALILSGAEIGAAPDVLLAPSNHMPEPGASW